MTPQQHMMDAGEKHDRYIPISPVVLYEIVEFALGRYVSYREFREVSVGGFCMECGMYLDGLRTTQREDMKTERGRREITRAQVEERKESHSCSG